MLCRNMGIFFGQFIGHASCTRITRKQISWADSRKVASTTIIFFLEELRCSTFAQVGFMINLNPIRASSLIACYVIFGRRIFSYQYSNNWMRVNGTILWCCQKPSASSYWLQDTSQMQTKTPAASSHKKFCFRGIYRVYSWIERRVILMCLVNSSAAFNYQECKLTAHREYRSSA